MPTCKKCGEIKKGLDGKKASYFLFPADILAAFLLSIPARVPMIDFAIYSLVVHNLQETGRERVCPRKLA